MQTLKHPHRMQTATHTPAQVPVWRVSWSMTGNILAVSDGNNAVTLWKETIDGIWQQVSQ